MTNSTHPVAPRGSTASSPGGAPAPEATRKRAFRPEIQGLRSMAVILVAVYHIWFGRVSGGVDVFLFISAFLMTLSFTGKLERGQRVGWTSLSTYWVHVFKRILPLAVVVVFLVLVATRLFLGPERWVPIMRESLSVVFYYENWYSIKNAVDYYAADSGAASPLRHFWSLSIQGQIFLTWPLLFALGGLISKAARIPARAVLGTLFGLVFAASLTYSVIVTNADQTTAYFNTFARLWEFALGSLLAIVLPYLKAPRTVRALLSWAGVLAILTCGAFLDVQGAFPGYVALWPTLAACFVIFAGQTETRWGADRMLSWKPLVNFGEYSYALYLVHWPLLVFYLSHTGQQKAGFFDGLGILVVSIVGAIVLTRMIASPLRSWKWAEAKRWRALLVVGACVLVGAGPVFAWQGYINYREQQLEAQADRNNPGAEILDPNYTYHGEKNPPLLPTSVQRTDDWAKYNLGPFCGDQTDADLHGLGEGECYYSVKQDHPSRTVVAVGNSHTEQWMTALMQTAKDQNYDLIFVRHPGCFFTTVDDNGFSADCQAWLPKAEEFIDEIHPNDIVIESTFSTYDGLAEDIRVGTEDQVRKWTSRGVNVIGIRDNARFTQSHMDCEREKGIQNCTFHHVTATTPDPTQGWEQSIPGYGAIDMDDLICPNGACPPEVGNVYTYIDDNHLTAAYVRSMQKFFNQRFDDAITASDNARAATASPSPETSGQ